MKIFCSALLLFLSLNAFGLNPSRTYKQLPDKYNMKYFSLDVKKNDGATLRAWYLPATIKSSKLVLIAHNGEGNMADYMRRINTFLVSGMSVVIFDYRGYGESSDFEIDKNMYIYPHFQDDLRAMIDHCRKNYSKTFSLYGWGMGGGLALGIGYNRPEIDKIIADTPFLSMEDLESRFESWDEPLEVPFAGYDKRFEPIHAVEGAAGENLKGVLLIVGSNDILYKAADMKKLASKSKLIGNNIFLVENPDRKDNFRLAKSLYIRQVIEFLNQ